MPPGTNDGRERESWAGTEPAPAFPGGLTWFNVPRPLALKDLRGKVVLIDFWTQGCINCQHIVPDLERLEAEYGDALAVIGVHSGKYANEHEDASVAAAVRRLDRRHPVANDPDFTFWDAYGARAWPTLVLIDPAGNLVGTHAGEGVYELFEPIIGSLIDEFAADGRIDRTPLPLLRDATAVSTVLDHPGAVAVDEGRGRLYIADSGHHRIIEAGLDGRLERVIGTGQAGFADGAADEASFRQPQGLALSRDGSTLWVADTRNHAIRAVDIETGEVTTIAGTGRQATRLPQPGLAARETPLSSPWGITEVDGTLYVSMAGVHQVWAIELASGTVSVFAGTSREGLDDGPRTEWATLAQPSGIVDDRISLYWVDAEASALRTAPLGTGSEVTTLVGTGLFDYGDEEGRGRQAKLQHPQGLARDGRLLYIADTYNHRIKVYDMADERVFGLAGSGERGRTDGPGASARFDEPGGIAFGAGRIFVADTNNHAVRVVDPETGATATLTLSNLAIAAGTRGQAAHVALDAVTVAPGQGRLLVTIAAPEGHRLNSLAPGHLLLRSADGAVVALSETDLRWSTDEATVTAPVPVDLHDGTTTLSAIVEAYYCRESDAGLCFIHRAEVTLPVTVAAAATRGDIDLLYNLPAAP